MWRLVKYEPLPHLFFGEELLHAAKAHSKPLYLTVRCPKGASANPAHAVLQKRASRLLRFYSRNGFRTVAHNAEGDFTLMLHMP